MLPIARMGKETHDAANGCAPSWLEKKELVVEDLKVCDVRERIRLDGQAEDQFEVEGLCGDLQIRRDQKQKTQRDQEQRRQDLNQVRDKKKLNKQT